MDTDRPFTTNPTTVSPRIAADHDRLVQSLYESVLEPERWHQTLEELRASLNASAINLFGLEMAAFDNPIVHISSNPDDSGKRNGDRGYWHGIQGQGAAAQGLMTGGVSAAERISLDRREFMASQFFNDCLRGLGVQDVACTSLWDDEPGMPRIVLSFFRGLRARGFEREEHERLNSLGQHLNRAFKIAWKLGKLSRVQEWHRSVMDGLRQAALVLDGHQKILQANPQGELLQGKPDGLLQVRHGRLVGLGSRVSMSLAEAFACADRGIPARTGYLHKREDAPPVIGSASILPLGEARILECARPECPLSSSGRAAEHPRPRWLGRFWPTLPADADRTRNCWPMPRWRTSPPSWISACPQCAPMCCICAGKPAPAV